MRGAARKRVLPGELLDAMALGLPVDERALDVGLLGGHDGLLVRERLGHGATVERRHPPAGRAVPGVDPGRPLEHELGADPPGPRDLAPHDRGAAGPGRGAAEHAQRFDRRESLAPAARGQVSGQDLVERLRSRGRRGEEHRRREEQAPPHALTSALAG
jgi:hypothetical protein